VGLSMSSLCFVVGPMFLRAVMEYFTKNHVLAR